MVIKSASLWTTAKVSAGHFPPVGRHESEREKLKGKRGQSVYEEGKQHPLEKWGKNYRYDEEETKGAREKWQLSESVSHVIWERYWWRETTSKGEKEKKRDGARRLLIFLRSALPIQPSPLHISLSTVYTGDTYNSFCCTKVPCKKLQPFI